MNREAKELLRIAKSLIALDFPSEEALHKYLKEHPNANRSKHHVLDIFKKKKERKPVHTVKTIGSPYKDKESGHYFYSTAIAEVAEDGVQHGKTTVYDHNKNKKSEHEYKDGKKHGNEKTFHSNGKLRSQGKFKNGKADGKHETYHSNGNKRSETHYKDGKLHGSEKYYDSEGNHLSDRQFEDDKLVKHNKPPSKKWLMTTDEGF